MAADCTFADVPIDRVRDFWNRRPCNIRHSPKAVGSREYFDEVEARKYKVEPHKFIITFKEGDQEKTHTITVVKITDKAMSTKDEDGKVVECKKKS